MQAQSAHFRFQSLSSNVDAVGWCKSRDILRIPCKAIRRQPNQLLTQLDCEVGSRIQQKSSVSVAKMNYLVTDLWIIVTYRYQILVIMKCLLIFDNLNDIIYLKCNKNFSKHVGKLAKAQGLMPDIVRVLNSILSSNIAVQFVNDFMIFKRWQPTCINFE